MKKELEALHELQKFINLRHTQKLQECIDTLDKALTTYKTLIDKIKTKCELHQAGKTRDEYHRGYRQAMFTILNIIKESEETK